MSARAKRLYRVTATYWNGDVSTRHYQSANAAKERRDRLIDQGERDGLRKLTVTIVRSDPITWPNDGSP